MTTAQPSQLKDYFPNSEELKMQADLKDYLTGKIKPGIHLIVGQYQGKLTDYYVAFLVEQPFNPRPFIINVMIEATCRISKKQFIKDADKVAAVADKLPERKAALMLNIQTQLS